MELFMTLKTRGRQGRNAREITILYVVTHLGMGWVERLVHETPSISKSQKWMRRLTNAPSGRYPRGSPALWYGKADLVDPYVWQWLSLRWRPTQHKFRPPAAVVCRSLFLCSVAHLCSMLPIYNLLNSWYSTYLSWCGMWSGVLLQYNARAGLITKFRRSYTWPFWAIMAIQLHSLTFNPKW